MALIQGFLVQGAQMTLVLLLAPLLTGFVRKVKARLLRRQVHRSFSRTAICFACYARKWYWRTARPGCFGQLPT
jgi:hypothetical protein